MTQLFRALAMAFAMATALIAANPAAAASAPYTESISVTESGGLAGTTDVFSVDGTTLDVRAAQALSLAAGPQYRALAPIYLPANPCCDRHRYVVVTHYSDDTDKIVVTMEGVPGTPPVLLEVIDLVTATGAAA
ncbi:hypothetical protein ODJ79_40895 [Actinoplanes sp. KI2]|uniref:hypothetical protein n=1 Tax=Actinoplanes sp. KI2 TaxID=2983315 RepID=UPI0021D60F62|nr:hypothetical protein [Actinoplanes sp. KI2]MCU7730112.1 hypothetical protein [Actinoplanes sp. KI2]